MSAASNGERTIAVVLYPGLAALDFIGPLQVLKTLEQFEPRYKVVVVAARREPMVSRPCRLLLHRPELAIDARLSPPRWRGR